MLFNIYVNGLIQDLQACNPSQTRPVQVNEYPITCLMYADDLLILSETWEGLKASLDKLGQYVSNWGLRINSKKTKILVFNKAGKKFSHLEHKVNNVTIGTCCEYTYLGLNLTSCISMKHLVSRLFIKANRALFAILRSINCQSGAKA